MPPGVKCAWSTSLSLKNGGGVGAPPSARSTNWFRKRDAVSCLPCLRPHCFQHARRPYPLVLLLGRRYDGAESIGVLSFKPGPRLVLFFGFSLSQRKIYVNRHVDTCLNVAGARARAERGEEPRLEGGGEGLGSRVTGMQCRISRCPGHRVQREKRTPRDAVARRGV